MFMLRNMEIISLTPSYLEHCNIAIHTDPVSVGASYGVVPSTCWKYSREDRTEKHYCH